MLPPVTNVQQAMNNSKERFVDSPKLADELLNAVIDALAAHDDMSLQVPGACERS